MRRWHAGCYVTRAGGEKQARKEVIKMKMTISLLSNLLVSSTLFWSGPMVQGGEIGPWRVPEGSC
jgi:hypothetical protein